MSLLVCLENQIRVRFDFKELNLLHWELVTSGYFQKMANKNEATASHAGGETR